MSKQSALHIILFLLLSFNAAGNGYLVEHFSCPEGLSDSNVGAVACDRNGIIWIGSHNGLDRYDGHRFKHYKLPQGDNIIRFIRIDNNGGIWIATSWNVFHLDPSSEEIDTPVSGRRILQLSLQSDGKILVLTNDDKITVINPCNMATSVVDCPAKYLAPAADGRVFILGTDNELRVTDDGFRSLKGIHIDGGLHPFAENGGCMQMEYAGKYIFSGTPDNAFALNVESGKVKKVPWVMTWQMTERSDGTLLAATNQGLYILDKELNRICHFSKREPTAGFLRDEAIQALCEDLSGGIWIGTYYTGIAHLTPNYADIKYYSNFPGCNENTRVREIVQDDDGDIWFGTETEGLFRIKTATQKIEKIPLPQSNSRNIVGLLAYRDSIWLGTYSSSTPVQSIDRKNFSVHNHYEIGYNCSRICKDGNGGIWFSCNKGTVHRSTDNGKCTTAGTLDYKFSNIICDDNDNSIWIAASYSYVFNKKGNELIEYSWPNGKLPSNSITDIFQDSRQRIWISAEGSGLMLLNRDEDKFIQYPGCEEKTFMRIVEDRRGILWLTSIGGILALNPNNGHSRFFGSDDGFNVDKFNNASLLYSKDDRIYAGSSNGLVSFSASAISEPKDAHEIVITDIIPINRKSDKRRLDASTYVNNKLSLRHRDNSFEIYVTNSDYSIPKHTQLEYKVDGLDNEWAPVHNGAIKLTGIPTGHYSLKLRSIRSNGTLSGQEKEMKIIVRPYLMASAPFLMVYLVLAFIFTYIIVKTAHRKGAEAAAREATLMTEKQIVENEKKLYASKVEFLSGLAHEIRTPLALIRLPLESLKAQFHNSPDYSVRENLDIIDNNSEKLSQFINELLDFQKLEKTGYSVNPAEYDIREIVRVETDRFRLGARRKNLEYSVLLPYEPLNASVDKSMLEKIIWNLCSNAVKYSESRILIILSEINGNICLSIENDGEVVAPNMRENIFKPFVRCRNGNYTVEGTGLGLSTSRNFAALMGGTLVMDNDFGTNRFILKIPVTHTAVEALEKQSQSADGNIDWKFPEIQGHRNTLMIVEDNEEMALFLKRQFEPVFNIISAGNGTQAMNMIKAGTLPSIIISDIMMPETDGFELCRSIKRASETCHIPVILISAKTDSDSFIQGYDYGADAYIQKPFSTELLATTVRSILENRNRLMKHYASNPIVDPVKLKSDSPDIKFLRIIQNYVLDHIEEPEMKIVDLAEAASTSVSHLQKRMKSLTGMGPNEYIQQLRLKKAAELLLDESIAVSNVSLKAGFASHSYFSSSFRKKYGITPKQFRENKGKTK